MSAALLVVDRQAEFALRVPGATVVRRPVSE